jgi:hypothetical protein
MIEWVPYSDHKIKVCSQSLVDGALVAPVAQSVHSSDTMRIDRLGPSWIGTSSSVRTLGEDAGFVVIRKEPVSFTLETTVRLAAARQIRSLTGNIVEGIRDPDFSPPRVRGLPKCSIAK